MTDKDREYFQNQADMDKVRYLDEMRAFYDEVERIGNKVGTVRSGNGHYAVANTSQSVAGEQQRATVYDTPQNTSQYQKLPEAPPSFYFSSIGQNDGLVSKPEEQF